jgi:hypothetical protein
VAKEKGQNLKQLSSLDPEKRLYELVKIKTGFQPTFNIIYDSIFNFPTTSIINSSEEYIKVETPHFR